MRTIYIEKNIPKMLAVKTLGALWPEVCWTPLSPVVVADLPEPTLPGPRWVKVRNRQCGICATDLTLLFVRIDPSVGPAALPGNRQIFLGHETVGEVVEAGPGVTRFKPGDRVILDKSTATGLAPNCLSQELGPICAFCARGDFALCENTSLNHGPQAVGGGWGDGYIAHETGIYAAPPELSDDLATLVEPMSVALRAVLRRPPTSGDRVLVVGAGVIGLLTIQAARAVCPGSEITALARYPHQAEAARRCGADTVMAQPGGYASAAKITGAKLYAAPMNKGMLLGGFDVIYDCIGSSTTIEDSLRWARAGGAVVLVGIDLTRVRADLNPIWYQEVDLIGSKGHGCEAWDGRRMHTYDRVLDLIRAGKLRDAGLITHRFRFEDYRRAIATATARASSGAIKVVFDYRL